MGFKAEVRSFINDQGHNQKTIDLLVVEIVNLRKQNNSLMDRLMATNFQELRVYSNDEDSIIDVVADEEPSSEYDYQNAGEIV